MSNEFVREVRLAECAQHPQQAAVCATAEGAIAQGIAQRGLAVPVIFFLEMYKPLTTLAAVSLDVAAPCLSAFVGSERCAEVVQFLRSRERVEALILAIEQCEKERQCQ